MSETKPGLNQRTIDNPPKKDIRKPPQPHLKVSYVVPISGEVANGNIFYQLKDLTAQRGNVDEFEIIYVVNNTRDASNNNSDSYKENQQLLSLLQYVAGETDAVPHLEEWQQRIVTRAREKGIHFHTLDLSSEGIEGNNLGNNIELARTIGENLAIERFNTTTIKQNGAIVMMDADTRIGHHVTEQVVDQLVNTPDVDMLRISYDLVPGEGGERLYQTTAKERISHNIMNLQQVIEGRIRNSDWYAIKSRALKKEGSNRTTANKRDQLKPASGKLTLAHDIRIYTQDRARPEDIGGQFGATRLAFLKDYHNLYNDYALDPALTVLLNALPDTTGRAKILSLLPSLISDPQIPELVQEAQTLYSYDKQHLLSRYRYLTQRTLVPIPDYSQRVYDVVTAFLEETPEVHELQTTVEHEIEREKIRHTFRSDLVTRILERIYARDDATELSEENINDYLLDDPNQQTSYTHFIRSNPWIIAILNEVRNQVTDATQARELLNRRFRELLQPFEETQYTKANAIILGLLRFFEKVRVDPNEYPEASKLTLPLAE